MQYQRRVPWAAAIVWTLLASASAQAPDNTVVQARLARLAQQAEALENKLPSFACRESFISQELRGGKVKHETRAAGDLRVLSNSQGKMDEQFTAVEVNGRPYTPGSLRPPLFVTGGFRHALGIFRSADQPCFAFHVAGDRMDFETSPTAHGSACEDKTGVTGTALFDDSGTLKHIELHIEEQAAERRNAVPFGMLDLSGIELGGTSFLLSTHVIAEKPHGKSTFHWEATYSDCRLYEATIKISDPTPVDTPAN